MKDPKELYKTRKEKPAEWMETKIPQEILHFTKIWNCQNFSQAELRGTSFTKETQRTKFNWNALMQKDKLVLEGQYTDNDITEDQHLVLNHMQWMTPVDKFNEKVI